MKKTVFHFDNAPRWGGGRGPPGGPPSPWTRGAMITKENLQYNMDNKAVSLDRGPVDP